MFGFLLAKTLLGAPILLGFFAFSYGVVALGVKLGILAPKKRQPPVPPPVSKPPKPEKVYYLIENATKPRTPKLKARRVYFSDEKPPVSSLPEQR